MEQILFDEVETTRTEFVGFIAGGRRFDFTLTYSRHFYGKTIVTCLQSNRSALIDAHDLDNAEFISSRFSLTKDETEDVVAFLKERLGDPLHMEQY